MTSNVFTDFQLRVRAFECDYYGHVNNATYLNYLEAARMEVLEEKNLSLKVMKESGFSIVLRKVNIHYRLPAVFGDTLCIKSSLFECTRTNGTFYQEIFRKGDDKLIADAYVNWVVINTNGRPVRVPQFVLDAFGVSV